MSAKMEWELDPAIAALFETERQRADPTPAARERVMLRVAASMASPLGSVTVGAKPSLGLQAAPRWWRWRWPSGRATWLTTGFVLGALVGARVQATVTRAQGDSRARPDVSTVTAVPRVGPQPWSSVSPWVAVAPSDGIATSTVPAAVAPPAATHEAPRTPPPGRAEPPDRDVDLAAERALLEIARTSLSRGRGSAALDALGEHERQFPRGKLVEEREALAIQALVQSRQSDEARARAARFKSAFPDSILLPVVDAAIAAIP